MPNLRRERYTPYLFLFPAYGLLFLLWFYPLLYAGYLSLYNKDFNKPTQFDFVGLGNYIKFFTIDPLALTVTLATIIITLATTLLSLGIGLATAYVLMKKRSRLIKTLIIYPYAVPTIVVSLAILWIVDPTYGIFTYLYYLMTGIKVNLLSSPTTALMTVISAYVWKYYALATLILLAALEGVPQERYEAAMIDGADALRRFIYITIPSIKPTLVLLTLLLLINGFQAFDALYQITFGGPFNTTTDLVLYAYQNAFTFFKISYGSAVGILSSLVMLGVAVLYLRVIKVE